MALMQFPIVNTQMHIRQGYPPHDSGIQEDVFIKDVTGQSFVGQVPEFHWIATCCWRIICTDFEGKSCI